MGKTKTRETQEKVRTISSLPHVDLDLLRDQEVSPEVFRRGVNLYKRDRAFQNPTYPWKYLVAGDPNSNGVTAYQADLSEISCGCRWYKITGSFCKHMVAALLDYIAKQE